MSGPAMVRRPWEWFYEMQRTGIQPNHLTFTSVLPACSNLAVVKEIHEEIGRTEFQCDVFVGCAVLDMYAKIWESRGCTNVFDKMPQQDVVLWNAIITGYAQNGLVADSLVLFDQDA
jgi:pentatricopeptide repeat protein